MKFMPIDQMAREYRTNAALLELRLTQLQYQLTQTRQLELRRRLKHRIGMLHVLINEARSTSLHLAEYHAQ